MKFIIKLATIASITCLASNAFAADAKNRKAKTPPPEASSAPSESYGSAPWGMAGCSIWNYVIKDKEQGPQIGVWALEHFVFGVQTFAISSGSSNCVDHMTSTAQNEQEVFVSVNLASLQKEAAQGQGEHLGTLAEIFGCDDKSGFAQMSQDRYEVLFKNEEPTQIIQSYKAELKAAKRIDRCSRVG